MSNKRNWTSTNLEIALGFIGGIWKFYWEVGDVFAVRESAGIKCQDHTQR